MRTTIVALIATLLTLPCLAEHDEEPEYGYYWSNGSVLKQHRMQDGSSYVSIVQPFAESTFTLPHVNQVDDDEQDIDLQVNVGCFVWPRTMEVLTTTLNFQIDPFFRERRSIDEEVTFQFQNRRARRTLKEHTGGLRYFTLTDDTGYNGANFVEDDRLVEDVLEELLTRGRISVEVEDDGDEIEFVVVARPSDHATQNIFDAVSRCYYGAKHEDVVIEDSAAIQSMATESHVHSQEIQSALKDYSDFNRDRLGTLNSSETDP